MYRRFSPLDETIVVNATETGFVTYQSSPLRCTPVVRCASSETIRSKSGSPSFCAREITSSRLVGRKHDPYSLLRTGCPVESPDQRLSVGGWTISQIVCCDVCVLIVPCRLPCRGVRANPIGLDGQISASLHQSLIDCESRRYRRREEQRHSHLRRRAALRFAMR